jgi:hypothetical protein
MTGVPVWAALVCCQRSVTGAGLVSGGSLGACKARDPLGANAAEKGDKTLQKRRQRSQDIELLR